MNCTHRFKGYFLFFLFMQFGLQLAAQEYKSIQGLIPFVKKEDSLYLIKIVKEASTAINAHQDSGRFQMQQAIILCKEKKFYYGLGWAYVSMAGESIEKANYIKGDSFLNIAYPYCYAFASVYKKGRLLAMWNDKKCALEYYQGNNEKAIRYAFKMLVVCDQYPNDTAGSTQKISAYFHIGALQTLMGQPNRSLFYLLKAKELSAYGKKDDYLPQIYGEMGNAYAGLEKWDLAKAIYHEAIVFEKQNGKDGLLQLSYLALSAVFINTHVYDSAIYYLKISMAMKTNAHPYVAQISPSIHLCEIYTFKKKYDLAIFYGERALKIAKEIDAKQSIAEAEWSLSKAYAAAGEWEMAYRVEHDFSLLNDSLSNVAKIKDINQLDIKYRTAEKDRELTSQKFSLLKSNSNLREKNFWIASISIFVLFLISLLLFYRRNYKVQQKLKDARINVLERDIEIEKLRSVMEGEELERSRIAKELHDGIVSQLLAVKLSLNHALTRYYHAPLKPEDFQKSIGYLEQATVELRNTAHNLMSENVTKAGLLTAIENYSNQIQEDSGIEIIFKKYGTFEPTAPQFTLSVYRIVQELLQNILKHAQATRIFIQINNWPGFISISVEDNGVGFVEELPSAKQGIGLYSIKQRVQSLNGVIEIHSDENGTSVYIEFDEQEK